MDGLSQPKALCARRPPRPIALAMGFILALAGAGLVTGATVSLAATGDITRVAGGNGQGFFGDGGPAKNAKFGSVYGLAFDSRGSLFIVDANNYVIRKVIPGADGMITGATDEIISTVAGTPNQPGSSGDGGQATSAKLNFELFFLSFQNGIAFDQNGNLFISDSHNRVVRKVVPGADGTITGAADEIITRFAATNVLPSAPGGLAFDRTGNLYFADTSNERVRKVDPTGMMSTAAGTGFVGFGGDGSVATDPAVKLSSPKAVAVDASGNFYIADAGNHRIRKVDAATGIINTVVGTGTAGSAGDGGSANQAQLNDPVDIVVDPAGNLYIADELACRIRKVAAGPGGVITGNETITTVAGTGTCGFSAADDGHPATNAKLSTPHGVAVDASGNIYISDGSIRVYKVFGPTPSITGLTASSGTQGTTVSTTITGTDLGGTLSADFGAGITVSLGSNTATSLTATLTIDASAAPGARTFSVTTLAGTGNSGSVTFTVLAAGPAPTPTLTPPPPPAPPVSEPPPPPPPRIASVSVGSGMQGELDRADICGDNLAGAGFSFGFDIFGTLRGVGPNCVTYELSIGTTAVPGARLILVSGAGGTATFTFTVLRRPDPPGIEDMTIREGVQGTTVVTTIKGTNLGSATAVDFGPGVGVTRGANTDTTLQVMLVIDRNAPLGSRTVSVTTVGGTGSNASVVFTVNRPGAGGPRPTITSPADGSRLPIAPNRVTFAWTPVEGTALYGFELTNSGNPFPQLAGTTPHPGGLGFLVLGTSLTTVIPANAQPGQYQFRVIAFSESVGVIGTWSDPVTVEVR